MIHSSLSHKKLELVRTVGQAGGKAIQNKILLHTVHINLWNTLSKTMVLILVASKE